MCLTEPCCSPRESQARFSASTEAEKSFKPGRKIRCDPQMRRDGWRNSSTVDLWFPSHTTEPHRCCGKDGEEADNSQHLFLIQKINRMELHHPCPCAEAEACAGHAAVGLILGHRGSNARSCRAWLQGLLLLWGLLSVNLPHKELLVVGFAVVFLSPQHFVHLWCFQHVSSKLWSVMSVELQP